GHVPSSHREDRPCQRRRPGEWVPDLTAALRIARGGNTEIVARDNGDEAASSRPSRHSHPPRLINGRVGHDQDVSAPVDRMARRPRSEEHTSELQSLTNLVCRLLLEKKKKHDRVHNSTPNHRMTIAYL